MKVAVVAVLLCLVVVSVASAQVFNQAIGGAGITARSMGMGGVGVGIADDSAAWFQNPAGLAALSSQCPEGKTWANDASATYAHASGSNSWGVSWSGWDPAKALGAGAGYMHTSGTNDWGAGFGMGLKNSPLSAGISIVHGDVGGGFIVDEETLFDIGLMYRFARPDAAPIRAGLLVEDVTGESAAGPFFDLGVAWPVNPKLLLAADVTDLTGETVNGPFFNIGGELVAGAANEWRARAGIVDNGTGHDIALGGGYVFKNNWRVDAAWVNLDPSSLWSVSASYDF